VTPPRDPSPPVSVTALGMVSSLGNDVITACAAARAGLTRPAELTSLDFGGEETFGDETLDGPPEVVGHPVRGIADGFTGLGKALLLGGAALDDLLAQRPLSATEAARTGFLLNLSDHHLPDADARARQEQALPSTRWRRLTARLHVRLAESHGLHSPPRNINLYYGGHIGVAMAVKEAVAMIARGEVDRCIVAAIDALTEPGFLLAAARLRQLRTNDNPVGLIPGEAAAAFLIERGFEATRAGFDPIASLGMAVVAQNDTDLLAADPRPTGVGLASLLDAVLQASPPIGFSIGDLNGTPQRAFEWGSALLRLRARHRFVDQPAWFPAVSFGDTGAASGAVGVCVAARAFARGYAPGESGIVWLSSENGIKGAIVLRAPR
jgi:3-oxoacyl-[acyl-carrier-protein] synthase I